jgi:hypothetical protein
MSALRAIASLAFVVCLVAAPGTTRAQGEGVTPTGQKGHIHVVKPGDTLWAITDLYLGTPWIWPSIWKENEAVRNPHRIYPGDLIWITDGEMRKITAEEAEALMRGERPAAPDEETTAQLPAAPGDPFAGLDDAELRSEHILRYPGLSQAPFVSSIEMRTLGSVLGTHDEHYWLVQEQRMVVSLGEGETQAGESYSVFRPRRRIHHPETGDVVGHFVEVIGRIELTEVHPESSYAMVRWSSSEIEPGDRLMPLIEEPEEIAPAFLDEPVEGVILAQQPRRLYAGAGDLVMLDRGIDDGLVRGAELVVYRDGGLRTDKLEQKAVQIPTDVIGRMFVLKTSPTSSVALVTRARTEVEPGDRYRSP